MAAVLCFKGRKALARQLLQHGLQPAQNAGQQLLPTNRLKLLPLTLLRTALLLLLCAICLHAICLLLLLRAGGGAWTAASCICCCCCLDERIHTCGGLAVGQIQPHLQGSKSGANATGFMTCPMASAMHADWKWCRP